MVAVICFTADTVSYAATTTPVDNAIAVADNGQCAGVRHYFSSTYDTPIPDGWTIIDPAKLYIYETPLGNCKISPTYDATCCRDLGLTYTDDSGWKGQKTSTETVSICGGGLATNSSTYCNSRAAETRTATVEESCYYSGLLTEQLVVNPTTKYCGLVMKADAYGRFYSIYGDQLGTKYDVKDSTDYTKTPTLAQCPNPEIKGTVYQRQNIDQGLWFEGRWCDVSKVASIGDCCVALGLTRVEPSAMVPTSSGSWSAVIMIAIFTLLITVIAYLIYHRRRKPITAAIATAAPPVQAPHHSWFRRWWWLIIVLPVLAIIWALAWLLLVGFGGLAVTVVGLSFYYLLGAIMVITWWRHGRTGKVMSILTIISALVLLVPTGYRLVNGRHNYIRVNRQAATDRERELITQAEIVNCPANIYCAQPLAAIDSTEASNAGPLDYDKIRMNIHSELDYEAQVSTTFPGSFSWPEENFSLGETTEPVYYDQLGQKITADQCRALAGADFHAVGMWVQSTNACPLCGSGGVNERRVYFDQNNQVVCQAILSYGQWISRAPGSVIARP